VDSASASPSRSWRSWRSNMARASRAEDWNARPRGGCWCGTPGPQPACNWAMPWLRGDLAKAIALPTTPGDGAEPPPAGVGLPATPPAQIRGWLW